MADDTPVPAQDEKSQEPNAERAPAEFVTYWKGQLDAYDDEFKPWTDRCKKIVRRYRDERQDKSDGTVAGGARFNSLWSNIQTLQPAIYIKAPQPVVERRYLDKDPMARVASMTLERALEVQIEVGYLHPSMRKAVLDYLLCGRGTLWERYEPTYGEAVDLGEGPEDDLSTDPKEDAGEAPRPVTYEKSCTDYVAWNRFRHSPAAVWEDVWWVNKTEMLTRKELRARFKEKDPQTGKLIADLIPLRDGGKDKENDREKKRKQPRACIEEIWDKTNKEVIFIAPDWPNAPLERTPDPLNLETFWPCATPLYATLTNDCLVPVPDYVEYQDQAEELDNLTQRIAALTDAIRVNGVYDASYPELKRILQEGVDNRMIGVKNYAEFASKGGLEAAMDFVPIKDVVEALIRLYEARDRTKADMAEITGLSDIIRGQAQGAAKTATEQQIKGNFATLRLEDRKKEVARFARDMIAIKAEIVAEQFSPEILSEMTGMIAFLVDEIKAEAPPPMQPGMGHNGGPPMASPGMDSPMPGAGAPGGSPSPAAGMQPEQLAQQRFMQACELLKNDKMRTFRIDVETDSTVEVDKQAAKESVVEMFTAIGGFLEKALPIGQMVPELAPALGQSILFAFRTFGAGRDVEGVWEQAIDKLTQQAKNPQPKPPSPEEIKAQAEIQKQQMENQRAQAEFQMDQQRAAMEMEQEKAKLVIERERLNMEREKMGMEMQALQMKAGIEAQTIQTKAAVDQQGLEMKARAQEQSAAIETQAMERQAQLSAEADERSADGDERKAELAMQTAEAKAKQAQKPKVKADA